MATILSALDLAAELNTTSREARKFLRSITPKEDQPGKGSRWEIKKADLRSLRTKFRAYEEAQAEAQAKRAEKVAQEEAPEVEQDIEEGEPTEADLAAIEEGVID